MCSDQAWLRGVLIASSLAAAVVSEVYAGGNASAMV
jgi:hypothetical protein